MSNDFSASLDYSAWTQTDSSVFSAPWYTTV